MPKKPTIFTRWANTQVGHEQPLVRPKQSETLDFEGEMAIIIGKRARHVAAPTRSAVVAGYSCYNDGSRARVAAPHQPVHAGQEFPRHRRLRPLDRHPRRGGRHHQVPLMTRVNGEEMQRATLDDLVFDVPA